MLVEKEWSLWL